MKPPATRRWSNTGIFVLLAGALAAGCIVGVQQLWRAVSDRPEFIVRPGDVTLASPWARVAEMKRDFLVTDRTGILRSPGVSIFTAGLCEAGRAGVCRQPVGAARAARREGIPEPARCPA